MFKKKKKVEKCGQNQCNSWYNTSKRMLMQIYRCTPSNIAAASIVPRQPHQAMQFSLAISLANLLVIRHFLWISHFHVTVLFVCLFVCFLIYSTWFNKAAFFLQKNNPRPASLLPILWQENFSSCTWWWDIQQERFFPKWLSAIHEQLNSENGVHNPSKPNSNFRIKIYGAQLHASN